MKWGGGAIVKEDYLMVHLSLFCPETFIRGNEKDNLINNFNLGYRNLKSVYVYFSCRSLNTSTKNFDIVSKMQRIWKLRGLCSVGVHDCVEIKIVISIGMGS